MRIPTAADATPPLLAPVRRVAAGEPAADGEPRKLKKHRRGKKAGGSESHSWEHSHSKHAARGEKRQMRQMLFGGAALFSFIVAGVVFSMNRGGKAVAPPVTTPVVAETKPLAAPPVVERSEASVLAEAEPLARKFLEATTVDELLPLVRNPAVAEARMRAFHPDGKVVAPGLSEFNSGGSVSIRGKFVSLAVMTRDHEERSLAFMETPHGLKIDWESWVGWSDISWEAFLTSKPVDGHVFRVTVSAVDYYNFGFTDESKWRSYRLLSADREHSIYGYVEKGSLLEHRIHIDGDAKSAALMLSLKFPAGATSNSQVEIERLVAEGWVEEGDSP